MDRSDTTYDLRFCHDENEDYSAIILSSNGANNIKRLNISNGRNSRVNLDSLHKLVSLEIIQFDNIYAYPFALPPNVKKINVKYDASEHCNLLNHIYLRYSEYICDGYHEYGKMYNGIKMGNMLVTAFNIRMDGCENYFEINYYVWESCGRFLCSLRIFGKNDNNHYSKEMKSIEEIDEFLSPVNIKPAKN